MTEHWKIHWLEASGDPEPFRLPVIQAVNLACQHVASVMTVPRLDILIQVAPESVIPEIGFAGRAYSPTLFGLFIGPENPYLSQMSENGTLVRQIVHEVHHCIRMKDPGYGWTLGEALVSEGLAGQFVGWLLGTAPERWEQAVELSELQANRVTLTDLQNRQYDHAAWFFGSSGYRRWYGYTLGFQLVAAWRRENPACPVEKWFSVTADEVIAAARAQGMVAK